MDIKIYVEMDKSVNYAAVCLRKQTITVNIVLENAKVHRLVCKVLSKPEIVFECKKEIEIAEEKVHRETLDLKVNMHFWDLGLMEMQKDKMQSEILVEVFQQEAPKIILARCEKTVDIQPRFYWDAASYPDTLPAFIQPKAPIVKDVLKDAMAYAALDGRTIQGYQKDSWEDVKKQAEYIYRALQGRCIHYVPFPKWEDIKGQEIFVSQQTCDGKFYEGNSLALAVLYAACLEAASLHACIVMIPGHAFCAVWLSNLICATTIMRKSGVETEEWEKVIAEMLPVECTTYTDGRDISFAQAVLVGEQNFFKVEYIIDIAAGREEGMDAAFLYTGVSAERCTKSIEAQRQEDSMCTFKMDGDQKQREEDLVYAFETDSDQNKIIQAAFQEKKQLVNAPTGNGSTQVIANVMLEAARRGEKVLLVSDAAGALEEVYEKINQVFGGLYNIILTKGKSMSDMVCQVKRTLDSIRNNQVFGNIFEGNRVIKQKYQERKEYLLQYYDFMRKKTSCGKSLTELIEMYEKYAKSPIKLHLDDVCTEVPLHDVEEEIFILLGVLQECSRAKGKFSEYLCYGRLQSKEKREALDLVKKTVQVYDEILSCAERLRVLCGFSKMQTEADMFLHMVFLARWLKECPVYRKEIDEILNTTWKSDSFIKKELIREFKKLAKYKNEPKRPKYRKCKKEIEKWLQEIYSPIEVRDMLQEFETNPDNVIEEIKNKEFYADEEGNAVPGNNIEELNKLKYFLQEVENGTAEWDSQIQLRIMDAIRRIVKGDGQDILKTSKELFELYKEYAALIKVSDKIIQNAKLFKERYPKLSLVVLLKEWMEHYDMDLDCAPEIYREVEERMKKIGLFGLMEQIEMIWKDKPEIGRQGIMEGYYKAWASYQIEKVIGEESQYTDFNCFMLRERFQQLFQREEEIRKSLWMEIIQAQKKRILNAKEAFQNNPKFYRLEEIMRWKETDIRSFFGEVPDIFLELCPCMMMDSFAVAAYVPPEFPQFDLIIVDKASQMTFSDARPLFSKAKRMLMFGDEKQLQSIDLDHIDERASIFSVEYAASMSRKVLRTHYGSENDSLIALMDKYGYDADIITFPLNDTGKKNAISYEFVEDGIYDKVSRYNEKEAIQIIQRLCSLLQELPQGMGQTIGVITFQLQQRDKIIALFAKRKEEDLEVKIKADDCVEIVNLDSCRGKKWDYVLVSPGFGHGEDGALIMEFDFMDCGYGTNFLYPILSCAKQNITIITSIEPSMLANARTEEVRNFCEFLLYARGDRAIDVRVIDRQGRTPGVVDSIAHKLETKGYKVHTNIGRGKFKVDIAIVDRNNPQKYAIGILTDSFCDGNCIYDTDGFCDGNCIYDREVAFPRALTYKGWKIYRLCNMNWYKNPQREISQIIENIEGGTRSW